jgi:hypothetical protein
MFAVLPLGEWGTDHGFFPVFFPVFVGVTCCMRSIKINFFKAYVVPIVFCILKHNGLVITLIQKLFVIPA